MRKLKHLIFGYDKVRRGECGVTLVETLVALAIMGMVAVVFLAGLATSSKAAILSQERVAAESLAKSQMEYVKTCDYDGTNNPPVYDEIDPNLIIPDGYSISVAAERLDPEGDGFGDDDGLQKITVLVSRNEEHIITIETYKVDR